MVFVENGRVVDRRSMMRAGTIADIFWGVLNTICCFFHCMLSVCWPAPLPRVRAVVPPPAHETVEVAALPRREAGADQRAAGAAAPPAAHGRAQILEG